HLPSRNLIHERLISQSILSAQPIIRIGIVLSASQPSLTLRKEEIHKEFLTYTPTANNLTSRGESMSRTNIDLDERLVRQGLKMFNCKSKRELVHLALTERLKGAKRKEILELRGKVKWEGDLEELRRSRL